MHSASVRMRLSRIIDMIVVVRVCWSIVRVCNVTVGMVVTMSP